SLHSVTAMGHCTYLCLAESGVRQCGQSGVKHWIAVFSISIFHLTSKILLSEKRACCRGKISSRLLISDISQMERAFHSSKEMVLARERTIAIGRISVLASLFKIANS